MTRTDHTGSIFGDLTVIRYAGSTGTGKVKRALWECRCCCGVLKTYRAEFLTRKTQPAVNCGCKKVYSPRAKTAKPRQTRSLPRSRPVSAVSTPRTASKPPQQAPDAGNIARSSGFVSEKRPPSGCWQGSLVIASRRTHTPWKEVAELTGWSIEECKAFHQKATFIQTHAA